MGDDGIGVHVVETLRRKSLPPDVTVFDGATRAFDVLEYIDGSDKAIIVDAYSNNKNGIPGSIYRFTLNLASDTLDESLNLSMHDINFIDALKAGKGIYKFPIEIVIIGIEPHTLEYGIGLSNELINVFPAIIDAVMSELPSL